LRILGYRYQEPHRFGLITLG